MGLSRTQMKVLETYPERFDAIADQNYAPDGSKYGLWTKLGGACQLRCEPPFISIGGVVQCDCTFGEVFSLIADDAASLRDGAKHMRSCDCCGSWFQG
jgi:hypothetical protein